MAQSTKLFGRSLNMKKAKTEITNISFSRITGGALKMAQQWYLNGACRFRIFCFAKNGVPSLLGLLSPLLLVHPRASPPGPARGDPLPICLSLGIFRFGGKWASAGGNSPNKKGASNSRSVSILASLHHPYVRPTSEQSKR